MRISDWSSDVCSSDLDAMLGALQHYREKYLKLSPLPALNEKTPLISHLKNPNKPISHDGPIRYLVQGCFDDAADFLESAGKQEEANSLRVATDRKSVVWGKRV